MINLLYKHSNNFGSLCGWVKSLNIFASGAVQELLVFEREEAVKILVRFIEEKRSSETFGKLVEIFFGNSLRFSEAILSHLQKEKECRIKALLIQLLLHFDKHPMEGSSLEDYIPGLHHRDEVFRCKVLHFLYKHYGEEALSPILQEVVKIDPPPSLFFSMTVNHYLRSHPEITRDEEIRSAILPGIDFSGNQMEKDRMLVLFQQMQFPILRHDFLTLVHTREEPGHNPDGDRMRLMLARFEKVDSFPKEKSPQ